MKNKSTLQLEEHLRAAAREYQPPSPAGYTQRLATALAQARVETAARDGHHSEKKSAFHYWALALAAVTSLFAVAFATDVTRHLFSPTPTEFASVTVTGEKNSTAENFFLQNELSALVDFFEDTVNLPEFEMTAAGDTQNNWPFTSANFETLLQNPAVRLACSGENLAAAYVLFNDLKNRESR